MRINDGEEPRLASPVERYFRRDVSTARHWEPERIHKRLTARVGSIRWRAFGSCVRTLSVEERTSWRVVWLAFGLSFVDLQAASGRSGSGRVVAVLAYLFRIPPGASPMQKVAAMGVQTDLRSSRLAWLHSKFLSAADEFPTARTVAVHSECAECWDLLDRPYYEPFETWQFPEALWNLPFRDGSKRELQVIVREWIGSQGESCPNSVLKQTAHCAWAFDRENWREYQEAKSNYESSPGYSFGRTPVFSEQCRLRKNLSRWLTLNVLYGTLGIIGRRNSAIEKSRIRRFDQDLVCWVYLDSSADFEATDKAEERLGQLVAEGVDVLQQVTASSEASNVLAEWLGLLFERVPLVNGLTGPFSAWTPHASLFTSLAQVVERLDQPAGDEQGIDNEAESILRELVKQKPRLISTYDLETATNVSRKTVGLRVNVLIDKGWAIRPNGPNGGVRATDAGIALIAGLDARLK